MLNLKPDTEEKFWLRSNIMEDPEHVYIMYWKRKKNHLQGNYGTVRMSKNSKKNLPMLIELHCFSKAQEKQLLRHLKPDAIKAICEWVINIVSKYIKKSDHEKRKINRNHNKIRDLVNPTTSKKKRKEILVQKGDAFLASLLVPVLGSLVGPVLKSIKEG